jgi:serine/threonine-protein kinase
VLAWAYEVTPGGVVRNDEAPAAAVAAPSQTLNYVIMGVVVLAVAFLMADRFLLDSVPGRVATDSAVGPGSAPRVAAVIPLPESAPLGIGTADIGFDSPSVALSPDGDWLVYVSAPEGEQSRLMRHRLDGFGEPEPVPGSEGAIYAFFSPSGKFIGFLTNERLKRVPVNGDDVRTIASSRSPVRARWMNEEQIHFIDDQGNSLNVVDVRSGEVRDLVPNAPLVFSDVLPGGQWALAARRNFSISGDYAEILRVRVADGSVEPIGLAGFDARWAAGHLLFGRNGDIYAAPFDAEAATVTGEARLVLEDVAMDSTFHQAHFALSPAGTLAYVPGTDRAVGEIVAVDLAGNERRLAPAPQRFGVLDLDHDDARLAIQVADVKDYVWVYDLAQGQGRKLPESTGYGWPAFAPDGSVAMTMSRRTAATLETRIRIVPADGSASYLALDSSELEAAVSDWTPDGQALALSDWVTLSMGLLPASGTGEIRYLESSALEWGGMFSPDGKWLSFSSDQSGRFEIWVRSLDDRGQRRQITANGGIESVWCPCGRIYFRRGDEFWFVPVEPGATPTFGQEQLAFTVTDFLDTPGRSYDVSSDGEVLYTLKRSEPAVVDRIHVIANWLGSLAAREGSVR